MRQTLRALCCSEVFGVVSGRAWYGPWRTASRLAAQVVSSGLGGRTLWVSVAALVALSAGVFPHLQGPRSVAALELARSTSKSSSGVVQDTRTVLDVLQLTRPYALVGVRLL